MRYKKLIILRGNFNNRKENGCYSKYRGFDL